MRFEGRVIGGYYREDGALVRRVTFRVKRQKYEPHQGAQEKARRLRQRRRLDKAA